MGSCSVPQANARRCGGSSWLNFRKQPPNDPRQAKMRSDARYILDAAPDVDQDAWRPWQRAVSHPSWPGSGARRRRRPGTGARYGGRGTAGGRWGLGWWENSGMERGAGGVEGGPGSQRLHNSHGLGRSEKAAERPAILASSPTTLRSEPGLPSLPLPPPSTLPPSTGHDTPRCALHTFPVIHTMAHHDYHDPQQRNIHLKEADALETEELGMLQDTPTPVPSVCGLPLKYVS